MRAAGVEQEGDALAPWRVGHLGDAALQEHVAAIAEVHADGVLVVSGAGGVGQQVDRPYTPEPRLLAWDSSRTQGLLLPESPLQLCSRLSTSQKQRGGAHNGWHRCASCLPAALRLFWDRARLAAWCRNRIGTRAGARGLTVCPCQLLRSKLCEVVYLLPAEPWGRRLQVDECSAHMIPTSSTRVWQVLSTIGTVAQRGVAPSRPSCTWAPAMTTPAKHTWRTGQRT